MAKPRRSIYHKVRGENRCKFFSLVNLVLCVQISGSETNLRDVDPDDFYLGVKSLDPSAIAFAPASVESAHRWNPRVVAIGEGEGKILLFK